MRIRNCASLISLAWLLACVGCGGGTVQIPTSYATYQAKDGSFDVDYPEGWEAKGGGKRSGTPVWAKFSSGPALIHFKASSTNIMANASMTGRSADANAVPTLAPVHLLHVDAAEQAKEEYDGYTEVAGGPAVMNCVLGPARSSEFTYKTSFGSAMHGYRVSIMGYDRGITVFCTCPESDWNAVMPVFDKVLASLVRGTAE